MKVASLDYPIFRYILWLWEKTARRGDNQCLFPTLVQHNDTEVGSLAWFDHRATGIDLIGSHVIQRHTTELVIADWAMETTGVPQPTQSHQEISDHSPWMEAQALSQYFLIPAWNVIDIKVDVYIRITDPNDVH
jgi:hypothetical protein